MDTRLLDVLHHPADVDLGAVAQRVDVDLDGILEEAIHQNRVLGRELGGAGDVAVQRRLVVDDLHSASAQYVGRPYQNRIADGCRDLPGLLEAGRGAELRRGEAGVDQHLPESAAVLSKIDGLGPGSDDRHTGPLEPVRQSQRGLPAELDDHSHHAGTSCAGE